MALDAMVQARIELDVLATLAQWYNSRGDIRALRSMSALVREALDVAVQVALAQGAEIVPATSAQAVLAHIGLAPRVRSSTMLHNMQQEVIGAEPSARSEWGKQITGNEPFTAEIRAALASPRVQQALDAQSQTKGKIIHELTEDDLKDGEGISETDEGEFDVDKLRSQEQ